MVAPLHYLKEWGSSKIEAAFNATEAFMTEDGKVIAATALAAFGNERCDGMKGC
eukprot:CAMPEP_0195020968 /NCGR_PEP_ID=MMETSP0326_2-20130528/36740_1 /TAXON_ID=2866 ORGANISM="Crypthecodinium cohnii, Strain Seligo" /NCGR_SAMPLE_ID=MMETSP0326_2 /ASSEMBLY_ACC=CAM_ASM_000348 /LENGTH=53 /DNA_ID=CAMNT_0040039921 /DNA_START=198 /DNA_END=359 /DNA_ORIENTATION=+